MKIKDADKAYVLLVNRPKDGMFAHKYVVYLQRGTDPLSRAEGKPNRPHFTLRGCGYSRMDAIAEALRKENARIEVFEISVPYGITGPY